MPGACAHHRVKNTCTNNILAQSVNLVKQKRGVINEMW